MKGETLKQMERREFQEALFDYEDALKTGDSARFMFASLEVHRRCRTEADRRAANRIFKNTKKEN